MGRGGLGSGAAVGGGCRALQRAGLGWRPGREDAPFRRSGLERHEGRVGWGGVAWGGVLWVG